MVWRNWKVVTLVLLGLTLGCVPLEEIDLAPCPCPEGYFCCDTLSSRCVQDSSDCPDTHPPSSKTPCSNNIDCPDGEICQSWSLDNDQLIGPQECRRQCSEDPACAAGETCKLILQDGRKLDLANLEFACISKTPLDGCADVGCDNCLNNHIGKTYCHELNVYGCFLALHPQCGLSCHTVEVENCLGQGCLTSENGAECISSSVQNICLDFDCSACSAPLGIGEFSCVDNKVTACTTLHSNHPVCSEICHLEIIEECSGSCVDSGGSHCSDQ
jgi:hypothetical protein